MASERINRGPTRAQLACPHDLHPWSVDKGLRAARVGEVPTHVSHCPRCRGPVFSILDPVSLEMPEWPY